MRKGLIAVLTAASLGGAAAIAIIANSALANPLQLKPLVALVTPSTGAQNAPLPRQEIQVAQAASAPPRGPGPDAPPFAGPRLPDRAELCQDLYARGAGQLAYLEARLNLTAAQSAAFARWRDTRLAAAKQQAADCATQPAGRRVRDAARTPPSPVERLAREETRLQRRLADIRAERPALEAFYNSLTPAQRQVLARAGMRPGLMGGGLRNAAFLRRGPMGPMGGPLRRPAGGPPGNAPPPPGAPQ